MCGNVVVIGMTKTITRQVRQIILLVQHRALAAWIVAVAGATMRGAVEYRIATAALPTTETATTAFV